MAFEDQNWIISKSEGSTLGVEHGTHRIDPEWIFGQMGFRDK